MANLAVTSLLYCPQLRLAGGVLVERKGAPTVNSYGESVPATVSAVTLDPVVIHNVAGKDLLRVPEADMVFENIMGYSIVRVYAGDAGGFAPDVVNYLSRRWRVNSVQDYEVQGGVFIWSAALIEAGAE